MYEETCQVMSWTSILKRFGSQAGRAIFDQINVIADNIIVVKKR